MNDTWTRRKVILRAFWHAPRFARVCFLTWLGMKLRLLGNDPPRGLGITLPGTHVVETWIDPWTKKDIGPVTVGWIVTVYARQKHQEFIIDAFESPIDHGANHIQASSKPMTMPELREGECFPLVGP